MTSNNSNSLSKYRKRNDIPLHDISFIANLNIGNLSKMERGMREPSTVVVLLYHILFGAPIQHLVQDRIDQEKEGWIWRSKELIHLLEEEKPPQSTDRIKFVQDFVNRLTKNEHGSEK